MERDKYRKSVYGVGYIGEGDYITVNSDNKHTMAYSKWSSMLQRCYSAKHQLKKPMYKDCTVCDEWHNFQNFAKWFDENYYNIDKQMHLDKDILVKYNKTYSPTTCVFVTSEINSLFTKRQVNRGSFPIGVRKKYNGKYEARCTANKKSVYLGLFDNINDAFNTYKDFKEEHVQSIANKYKSQIPTRLYDALLNYKVSIDD